MGQTTDKIEANIETKRAELEANLDELEYKVKAATDWKHHFRNHPMTMIGVAFGGGVVLAGLLGARRNRRHYRGNEAPANGGVIRNVTGQARHKAFETMDTIQDALLGVAATKIKDFVGGVVPGLQEELRRCEEKRRAGFS